MIDVTPATDIYNLDVYNEIPKFPNKILEIGTGSGALARQVKIAYPNVNYVGVEVSHEYVHLSGRYCDNVYFENIENASGELLREFGSVDVVIMADVLEHLIDPWKFLKRLKNWIKPSATLIVCIPNVQHWSIQFGLLAGNFDYSESGLLDKTHLRFFTKKTIVNMFESNGYIVKSIKPRIFQFKGQDDMLRKLILLSDSCGLNSADVVNDAAAFQYVLSIGVQ